MVIVDNANLTLTKELKVSNISSFKLLDLANVSSTQLFINKINNIVKYYTKARVIIALHKYLRNNFAC